MTAVHAGLESLKLDRGARPARSSRRAWMVATILVLLAVAATWSWATRSHGVAVRTAAVTSRATSEASLPVLNASGYVTARRRATVSSKITGKVTAVFFEEGMRVSAGQVLAQLDDAMASREVALGEAQLASVEQRLMEERVRLREAEVRLDRQRRLAKDGLVPLADLDSLQANVDALAARIGSGEHESAVAKRQLELRRTALADATIRAPFSGVVISKDAQPGETISPMSAGGGFTRTGIGTIVDMSSLEIGVDVGESFINRIAPGQQAVAVLDAYPEWRIPGRVVTVVPTADRQKATVLVRIAFDRLDPRILPDMGVKVAFLQEDTESLSMRQQTALTVPKEAVRRDGNADVVYVVVDRRAVKRIVRVGARRGVDIEVESGVAAGELVIIDGPPNLADGAMVNELGVS